VIIAAVGCLPIWCHSKNWGFYPIGGVSVVMLFILTLLFAGSSRLHWTDFRVVHCKLAVVRSSSISTSASNCRARESKQNTNVCLCEQMSGFVSFMMLVTEEAKRTGFLRGGR
jgi:hypothetical protein